MREAMTIRLPRDIQNALDALARQTGLTKTFFVQRAVELYLGSVALGYQGDLWYKAVVEGKEPLRDLVIASPWNVHVTKTVWDSVEGMEKARKFFLGLSTMDNPRESGMLVDGRRASYWCYLLGGQAFLSVIDDVRSAILVLGLADGDLYHDGLNGDSDVRNIVFPSSESYQPILACGARVAAIRKQKGISQREFAKMLGTSSSDLSFMEHGKRPVTRSMAERMAALLGVPVRRVLQG